MKLAQSFRAVSMATLVLISGCAFLHKRPPYPDPDRLVSVVKVAPAGEEPILDTDFLALRNESQTLASVAAYVFRDAPLTDGSEPERIHFAMVSGDFYPVLGVKPLVGRTLVPEENRAGGSRVAVISYNLWQRGFSGDPRMIGRTITLNQEQYTVVGITPADFQFPKDCDIWTPLPFDAEGLRTEEKSIGSGLEVIARLKPGVKLEQAQAEMNLIARKLESVYPETNNGRDVKLIALRESRIQKESKLEIQLHKPAN